MLDTDPGQLAGLGCESVCWVGNKMMILKNEIKGKSGKSPVILGW